MIIGLSGRIKSGKGMVSDYLINEYGFEKVTIAWFLKSTLAELYSLDLDFFYSHEKKEKNVNLLWNKDVAKRYAEIIKEHYTDLWYQSDTPLIFKRTRDAMQHIGTGVLRRYDEQYHVNKMLSNLDPKKKYVCDDVRFPNEKRAIEQNFGVCTYILRPKNPYISNHDSETALNWTDFDNVIINRENYDEVKHQIQYFIKTNSFKNILPKYKSYDYTSFLSINKETAYAAGLIYGSGRIVHNTRAGIEFTSDNKELVKYINKFVKSKKIIWNNSIYIDSDIIADNIKLWNITYLGKSFPEILFKENNKKLIKYWFYGVLHSSGIFVNDTIETVVSNELSGILATFGGFTTDEVLSVKAIDTNYTKLIFNKQKVNFIASF